jgi:hypothetical protein
MQEFNHWTAEQVIVRLEAAGRTLLSLPSSRIAPSGFKSNWPAVLQAAVEAYGYGTVAIKPATPSARAISEMDEAFSWLSHIPAPDDAGRLRRRLVLMACLINPVSGRKIWSAGKTARALGLAETSVRVWRAQGIDSIVAALNRRPGAVPSAELAALMTNSRRAQRKPSIRSAYAA